MSGAVTAYIALGSNLGERLETLRSALRALEEADGVEVSALSALYETAPVGGPGGQGRFLNAAAEVRTRLAPLELLDLLQGIEAQHHRTREVRWDARTLDLDILYYGDKAIQTGRLTLPHPRLHERRFVLAPLADIAPDWRHPSLGATTAELLAALDPSDKDDVAQTMQKWRGA